MACFLYSGAARASRAMVSTTSACCSTMCHIKGRAQKGRARGKRKAYNCRISRQLIVCVVHTAQTAQAAVLPAHHRRTRFSSMSPPCDDMIRRTDSSHCERSHCIHLHQPCISSNNTTTIHPISESQSTHDRVRRPPARAPARKAPRARPAHARAPTAGRARARTRPVRPTFLHGTALSLRPTHARACPPRRASTTGAAPRTEVAPTLEGV